MNDRKRVVLCPNPYKDVSLAVTKRCQEMLEGAGFEVKISPEYLEGDEKRPEDRECRPLEELLDGAVLVVSLGGDGTIMHTSRRLIGCNIPILGINLGTVGFLAELEVSDLPRLVEAARGEFLPSPRMMLRMDVFRQGTCICTDYALNDAVIHGVNKTIHVEVVSEGRRMLAFHGDGLVVATPTGSTAYSMSAGGPLVAPTAETLILTPICPHALSLRSCVLAADRVVSVTVSGFRGRDAFVSVDGGSFPLQEGDVLRLGKGEHRTVLARVGSKTFLDIVFEKLGERP